MILYVALNFAQYLLRFEETIDSVRINNIVQFPEWCIPFNVALMFNIIHFLAAKQFVVLPKFSAVATLLLC
jgi:hypothetical protein